MDGTALILLLSLCNSVLSDEFRLVKGPSRCAGKLEMRAQGGRWKQEKDRGLVWDRATAAAVCRQLDCGSVVAMTRNDDGMFGFNIEVTCSDTVRLVNGTSLCSGRLELKSDQLNQSWVSVNEDGFDQRDAEVVCRALGCGPLSVLQGGLFGEAVASGMSKDFKCKGQGSEAALSDCLSSGWSPSGRAVGLTCSEPEDVRLVGGGSRCAGTFQMNLRGEWKPVFQKGWSSRFAGEVCKRLNCGSPLSITRREGTSKKVLWELHDCNGSSLIDCVKGVVYSEHFTEMVCSDSVRLVHGSNHCSGRLEVKLSEWSVVCEAGFNRRDAEVVCREIGCGPFSILWGTHGDAEAPIWRKEVHCAGSESSLLDCGMSQPSKNPCPSGAKAVGLTCSDPEFRLERGNDRCSGSLAVKQFGKWEAAGDEDQIQDWILKPAGVICQRLDCGTPVSREIMLNLLQPVPQVDFSCLDTLSCTGSTYFEDIFRVKIICSDSVRLVNNTNQCSGRLELKTNQLWSAVCEKDFDQRDANVTCREIGCGPPFVLQGAHSGGEERRSEFQCQGTESALLDCRSSGSAKSTCSPKDVVGLTCSGYLRLDGENNRCAGTLEMLHQGEWRPVADPFELLDQKLNPSVCSELGCGSVSAIRSRELSGKPSWWISSAHVKSASGLREAVALNDHRNGVSLEVICSGVLVEPDISLFFYSDEIRTPTNRKLDIPKGSGFGVMCSIKPQYQGGTFELVSRSSSSVQSLTLPAVNHSTLFLFSGADHAHPRSFRCIYHNNVFSQNFSSVSRTLTLSNSAIPVDFIIRLVVIPTIMMISITFLYYYYKVSGNKKSRRHLEDRSTKSYLKVETAVSAKK